MPDIRYLLDENVTPVLRTELLRLETRIVVWKVGDPGAPAWGTDDPAILRWCEENFFLLVTNNRKSMPQHLAEHLSDGGHVPGIIELKPNMSIGETIEELLLIWGASEPGEYRDLIIYLPLF
ncbi:MAG: DUF5615 family PIN-like protein [Candidatus Aminicenantes bacterium]|nr:DUF5615 family PIN-like protein [Candidatus Aminicenantes bacterium]